MQLTLLLTDNPVYVNPEYIAFITEEDTEENKKKVHFSRIYVKNFGLPENIPNWIDVKESVQVIVRKMNAAKRQTKNI